MERQQLSGPAISLESSYIKFVATQAGADINGEWQDWTADIHFDEMQLDAGLFDVSVVVAAVETLDVDRDRILQDPEWFDAVRKIRFSMTDRGQDIIDSYLEMDNANSRCASPGLVLASGLPYPMEILHTNDYIVIVYAADYVRRIYLDGRDFPDDVTNSSFGFSRGEWKGETLVVTTTKLHSAFMSTRGQPVSADGYTIEHFFFDDKGYLHGDMWVHDTANYSRAPHLRRVYDRNFSPTVLTKVDCDPYSFFRALYLEGELETLWNRARFRR